MNVRYKHAFAVVLLAFLAIAPVLVAAYPVRTLSPAQDEDIMNTLLEKGAEALFANIDEEGVPMVLYGRLGIPTSVINFQDPMFDDCLALAVVSTHGEILERLMAMLGMNMTGDDGFSPMGPFTAAQFGDSGEPPDLISLIGTEARILVAAYLNVDAGTSRQRMGQILSQLTSTFSYQFSELYTLRIDQNTFPPEANVTLPFDSLDIYLYNVLNTFPESVDMILQVLGTGGLGDDIDRTVFTEAPAAAAGLVAIPDMQFLIEFVNETFGGPPDGDFSLASEESMPSFLISQAPDIEGPLAIGAVGYIGDQVVSSTTESLSVASLVGATSFSPSTEGVSVVLVNLPDFVNITSVTPFEENHTMIDNGLVLWNATWYGTQDDYVISFQSDEFPPLVTISRTFSSESTSPGGSVQVTVTVTNEGETAIDNVQIVDDGIGDIYTTIAVSGTTSTTVPSLGPGESATITYTVTFQNEGSYTFPKASVTYEYQGRTYTKTTTADGYTVVQDVGGLVGEIISDGWPYTGGILGLIALLGVVQVVNLAKGMKGGGGGSYQV
ncbi:MAG: CARDB domain-containing protein [Candidatus Thorarchaeota archaeon]